MAHRGAPLEVVMTLLDQAPRLALRDWARPPYDLLYLDLDRGTMDGTARLRPDRRGPDGPRGCEDRAPGRPVPVQCRNAPCRGPCGTAWPCTRPGATRSLRRFQRSVAAEVECIALPSDFDAARSALANVVVIPNTYPRPRRPAGNPAADGPPVGLFQGNLGYPPNIDGRSGSPTLSPRASGRLSRRPRYDSSAVRSRA